MFPLFAAPFAAVLGETDYSIFMDGPPHTTKTARATLIQQFFGPELSGKNLPGNGISTGLSLVHMLSQAKNACLVVDDLRPGHTASERAAANRDADRLMRSQYNQAARRRARGDGSIQSGKPPQGLLIITAEAAPEGDSLSSRYLRLDCTGCDLTKYQADRANLTACQVEAGNGTYAKVLAGFIKYIAWDLDEWRRHRVHVQQQFEESIRADWQDSRIVRILAHLYASLEVFIEFAANVGALRGDERGQALLDRFIAAARKILKVRRDDLIELGPAGRFLALLSEALACGEAHLTNKSGSGPKRDCLRWGWLEMHQALPGGDLNGDRQEEVDVGRHQERLIHSPDQSPEPPDRIGQKRGPEHPTETSCVRRPRGKHIGFIDDDAVWLIPAASLGVAQTMASRGNASFSINVRSLGRELHREGYLQASDERRNKYQVRISWLGAQIYTYLIGAKNLEYQHLKIDEMEEADEQKRLADLLLSDPLAYSECLEA